MLLVWLSAVSSPALTLAAENVEARLVSGSSIPVQVAFDGESWSVLPLNSSQSLPAIDRIRSFRFQISENSPIPNRLSLKHQLLLSSGDRLPAKLIKWQKNQTKFSCLQGVERAVPVELIESFRGPQHWELALPPGRIDPRAWASEFSQPIKRDEQSVELRLPPIEGRLSRPLPRPFSTGRLELMFALPRQQVQKVECVLGFSEQLLKLELHGTGKLFRVAAESGEKEFPVAWQPLRRSAGWHLLSVGFSPRGWRAAIDEHVLANGKFPQPSELDSLSFEVSAAQEGDAEPLRLGQLRLWREASELPEHRLDVRRASLVTQQHQQLFGQLESLSAEKVQFSTPLGKLVLPAWKVRGIHWPRAAAPTRRLRGYWVEVSGKSPGDPFLDAPEFRLTGVLRKLDAKELRLEHAYLGDVRLPLSFLRRLRPLGESERILIAPEMYHLGNEARPDWPVVLPDGTEREFPFSLEEVPTGKLALVVEVEDMESFGTSRRKRVRAGQLRTQLWCNEHRLSDLNAQILPQQGEVRVELDAKFLRVGENRLLFRQTPQSDASEEYDDFLLRNIRLEAN